MIFLAMSLLVGLYMGAFYENCDPLKAELVSDDNHVSLSYIPSPTGV